MLAMITSPATVFTVLPMKLSASFFVKVSAQFESLVKSTMTAPKHEDG